MTTTTALMVPHTGGSEVLEVREYQVPDPGPGEVQVEIAAAGVNFIDVYQREGVYPIPTPFVLGMEAAGVVRSLGAGVNEVHVGERVAWALVMGTAAGVANVPASRLITVPGEISLEIAAAAMLQGMTAHALYDGVFDTQPGITAVVHAAAGGVGQLLVQLITDRGGRVIATAGTDAKLEIAAACGAAAGVNYSKYDDPGSLAAAIRACNHGAGVDVVFDGVGKATFDASLASLRPRGLLAVFGAASGQVPPFDLQRLNQAGSVYLTRPNLAAYIADRDELLRRGEDVLEHIARGRLEVEIGGRYKLAEAALAYDDLEARRTTGKLLLTP
ncbi:MAG: quinone oxidoreductase family protein [Actinomycetales bacterium]